MLSIAGVSVLSVKDVRVAGAGDYGMRPLLPTQAGDEPLASRSLRPRYILLGETSPRATGSLARPWFSIDEFAPFGAKDPPLTPNC